MQGKGKIKVKDKDKLMCFLNDDTQNYPLCRLQPVVETFGHSTKWNNISRCNKSPQGC